MEKLNKKGIINKYKSNKILTEKQEQYENLQCTFCSSNKNIRKIDQTKGK